MAQEYIALLLLLGFFILIAFRIPVAVALGMVSFTGIVLDGLNVVNYVTQMYRGLDMFTVLAIPFFLITGFLASSTSVATRLLDLSVLLVGRVRGCLGHINVVVSMIFAGISGSATADTSGIGSVLIPMMVRRGYPAAYSAAITAISSTIGSIIPPSILMIIYGAYANVSVGAMFLGGFVPGIMVGAGAMIVNYVYARRQGIDIGEAAACFVGAGAGSQGSIDSGSFPYANRFQDKLRIVLRALPPAAIPLIIILGVTGGVFTATEAGFVALFYTLILLMLVYREISPGRLLIILRQSLLFYALPLLAAASAVLFGWVLTYYGLGEAVRNMVETLDIPAWAFLLLVVAIFLIAGTFLDGFPAIVLFSPMLLKAAYTLGIHPVQLGLITVLTLAVGLTTPPYGLCLLIAGKLAKVDVSKTLLPMLPFWTVTLGVIILCIFFPEVVLFLPRLVLPELF